MVSRYVEDRERLEILVDNYLAERETVLDATFENVQSTRDNQGFDGLLKSLIALNEAYGKVDLRQR